MKFINSENDIVVTFLLGVLLILPFEMINGAFIAGCSLYDKYSTVFCLVYAILDSLLLIFVHKIIKFLLNKDLGKSINNLMRVLFVVLLSLIMGLILEEAVATLLNFGYKNNSLALPILNISIVSLLKYILILPSILLVANRFSSFDLKSRKEI